MGERDEHLIERIEGQGGGKGGVEGGREGGTYHYWFCLACGGGNGA